MPSVTESGNNSQVDNKSRPNSIKIPETPKYSDVKRTSSASFKPPMSKESVLKKKMDVPPPDSSWFGPLSYIKSIFGGGKSSSEATSQIPSNNVKNRKVPTVKNTSNVTNAKVMDFKEAAEEPKWKNDESKLPSVLAESKSNPPVTTRADQSPRFSYTPDMATGGRRVKEKAASKKAESDDDNDPNGLRYNALRFVENKSTYLHTPDKKGTTSFRITTTSKVKSKPHTASPLLTGSSKRNRKSPVSSRKSSASPKKIPQSDSNTSVNFPTRLRSKSTPDHKHRPPYNPLPERRWQSPQSRTPPRKYESAKSGKELTPQSNRVKSLPASLSKAVIFRQEYDKRILRDQKRSYWKTPYSSKSNVEKIPTENAPEKSLSATTFFSNIFNGSSNGANDTNEKDRERSPTREAIKSAMNILSAKISGMGKDDEAKNKQKFTSVPKADTDAASESIFKNTFAKLSSLLEEKLSPKMQLKPNQQKKQKPKVVLKVTKPERPEPKPIHRRPKDHLAYFQGKEPRQKTSRTDNKDYSAETNRSQSHSPFAVSRSKSTTEKSKTSSVSNITIKKASFSDILKSPATRKLDIASAKGEKQQKPSFKSTLRKISTSNDEKLKLESLSSISQKQSNFGVSEEIKRPIPDYLKKHVKVKENKPKRGSSASNVFLTTEKSQKSLIKSPIKTMNKSPIKPMKVNGTFLKSRRDGESPTDHPTVLGQVNSRTKLSLSPYVQKRQV